MKKYRKARKREPAWRVGRRRTDLQSSVPPRFLHMKKGGGVTRS